MDIKQPIRGVYFSVARLFKNSPLAKIKPRKVADVYVERLAFINTSKST